MDSFHRRRDPVVNGYFMMWGNNNVKGTLSPTQRQTFVCYAWNYKLFGGTANATSSTNPTGGWAPMGKITQIPHPSETCIIFEKRTSMAEVTQADDNYYTSFGKAANSIVGSPVGRFRRRLAEIFQPGITGGGSVLFADGHVDFFKNARRADPSEFQRHL